MNMKLNPIYDYSQIKREQQGSSRNYVSNTGQKAPSVTQILSKTKDITHLLEWKKRVGEQVAAQITKESADLGTTMHTHLEMYLRGQERPGGTNLGRVMAKNMADVIIENGLCKVDEVWGLEVPLMFDTFWAGTTDLVGVYQGEPAIMDFKTTRKPKKREYVEDYRLQTVAYAAAHDWQFGTEIRKCVIFMCSQNLEYQEFVWTRSDYDQNLMDWLNRVHKYFDSH
jgi:ATP-dependent exoDNAse (exonuclease V) beta subunit